MNKRTYENPIIGDKVTFLKTSEETKGEYTLVQVELKAGGSNSLHYHKAFTEKFEVLNGELTVQVKKEFKRLTHGETYTVPKFVLHNFMNKSDKPVHFLVELRPGNTGFENCLKIGYSLAVDGATNKHGIPNKFSHLAILLDLSDTNLPGIYSLINPVMSKVAERARKKGVEKELIERYCL